MDYNNAVIKETFIKEKPINMKERIQNRAASPGKSIKTIRQECFECKICPYNTFRKPFLDKHMQQKHSFSKITVEKKDDNNSYNDMMDNYVIRYNDVKAEEITKSENDDDYDGLEFGCELCDFKSRYQNLLNLHLETHETEEGEMYQCTQCDFKTEEVNALRDHEKMHKKLTIFDCANCDYATRQKCNLKAHMRVHANAANLEKFICETCKKFVSFHYSALLRHIRIKHGRDGQMYKCDKCSFATQLQKQLAEHRKVHPYPVDVPMFKCEKCDFVTPKEHTIKRHVQRHEERERDGEELIVKEQVEEKEIVWFCCNLCEFRSKDQRYVTLHKKIHTRIDEINKMGESLVRSAGKNIESSRTNS